MSQTRHIGFWAHDDMQELLSLVKKSNLMLLWLRSPIEQCLQHWRTLGKKKSPCIGPWYLSEVLLAIVLNTL